MAVCAEISSLHTCYNWWWLTSWATEEELHLRSARAVADSDSTGKGNEVAGRDTVLLNEGLLNGDGIVEADIRVEGGLDLREDHDGSVGTSAAEKHVQSFFYK